MTTSEIKWSKPAQSVHIVAPDDDEYAPVKKKLSKEVILVSSQGRVYTPARHSEQVDAPESDILPAAQLVQAVLVVVEVYVPAAQLTQFTVPVIPAYFPDAQPRQAVNPTVEYLPAAQLEHELASVVA